jgi:integrase
LNRWKKHLSCIEKKRVSDLSPLDVERIKRNMRGKKPGTISNALELLRRILNHGKKVGLCPPLTFIIELPKTNNEVTEYLTPEQAAKLKQVLDEWPRQDIARMVKLAWLTGMRRGEIFKLQIDHIDFIQDIITLVDPKSGRDETIPMGPLVSKLLREQIEWQKYHYPESTFVFPGKNGGKRVECSAIKRIKKAAGLPEDFRPFHGLRHHMAVMLASSGEYTLDMIGELLTHKDNKITRRYAAFLPDAKKKAAARAEELLLNQMAK